MPCEFAVSSLFGQWFDLKGFRETSDDIGMGSFPEVRPEDAKA